jgi:glutathione S-transferase
MATRTTPLSGTLEIWGRRSAYNVQKVLWAIAELGLPHQHINAGGSAGGLDTPEFLANNPHGRIPVVQDGEITIWESHSILRYLGARYDDGSLWPADPAERSLADRWMDWTLVTQGPTFMQLFWGYYRTPDDKRNARRIAAAEHGCAENYRLLDQHLADHRYLAGERFTLGDVPAATSLYRYFEMGVTPPKIPNVRRWYADLAERPAYREHIMLPFEELRGRLDF